LEAQKATIDAVTLNIDQAVMTLERYILDQQQRIG